jgi:hypothetical protein
MYYAIWALMLHKFVVRIVHIQRSAKFESMGCTSTLFVVRRVADVTASRSPIKRSILKRM